MIKSLCNLLFPMATCTISRLLHTALTYVQSVCVLLVYSADIHNYSYDSGKTARRKPVTRRAVANPPKKRFSTYSIR